MAERKVINSIMIVLAVVGAVALIGWLLMALMMGSGMINAMMGGDLTSCCGVGGAGMVLGGVLLAVVIFAAVVWLVSRLR